MTVFRFMSKEEFENYKKGLILKNDTKHIANTNSVGFCFLNYKEHKPEEAMHFLSGIVSFDVCAIFETEDKLNKTYGLYAKPIKDTGNFIIDMWNLLNDFDKKIKINEYCTLEYSNKTMKLIKYVEDIWEQWQPREEQQDFKWKEL